MKTNKVEAIVEFMKRKSEVLPGKLYDLEDYEEVETWEEDMLDIIIKYLSVDALDVGFCPNCFVAGFRPNGIASPECSICDYGKRHGDCEMKESNYDDIREKLGRETFVSYIADIGALGKTLEPILAIRENSESGEDENEDG